jgi:hypothetical protein
MEWTATSRCPQCQNAGRRRSPATEATHRRYCDNWVLISRRKFQVHTVEESGEHAVEESTEKALAFSRSLNFWICPRFYKTHRLRPQCGAVGLYLSLKFFLLVLIASANSRRRRIASEREGLSLCRLAQLSIADLSAGGSRTAETVS